MEESFLYSRYIARSGTSEFGLQVVGVHNLWLSYRGFRKRLFSCDNANCQRRAISPFQLSSITVNHPDRVQRRRSRASRLDSSPSLFTINCAGSRWKKLQNSRNRLGIKKKMECMHAWDFLSFIKSRLRQLISSVHGDLYLLRWTRIPSISFYRVPIVWHLFRGAFSV